MSFSLELGTKPPDLSHADDGACANFTLIVQVKDSQPTLHRLIQDICDDTAPLACITSRDTARTRSERRVVTLLDPADRLASTEWHPHVAAIIRIERNVLTRSAKAGLRSRSTHTAATIANTAISAAQAADAIRAHWTIENTSHHTRGVILGKDRSRLRTNPGVFARLRSFAYNILKASQTHSTISQDRYRAALGGLKALLEMLLIQER